MRPWMYVVAAVVGSLVEAILDATLYKEGGSIFMKVGLVAGPGLLFVIARLRGADPSSETDQE